MSPTVLPSVRRVSGMQGRHVLITFLAFFGTVFAVNGALLYFALATHSGLVASEPYRKGLAYNERIAADERQAALGWSAKVEIEASGALTLVVADREGRPVSGLAVSSLVGRPTTSKDEQRVVLAEAAPGRYLATLGALGAGAWRVDIEARRTAQLEAGTDVYRIRRRVWLTP